MFVNIWQSAIIYVPVGFQDKVDEAELALPCDWMYVLNRFMRLCSGLNLPAILRHILRQSTASSRASCSSLVGSPTYRRRRSKYFLKLNWRPTSVNIALNLWLGASVYSCLDASRESENPLKSSEYMFTYLNSVYIFTYLQLINVSFPIFTYTTYEARRPYSSWTWWWSCMKCWTPPCSVKEPVLRGAIHMIILK